MSEAPARAPIRLGTSSWTAEGWEKTFYPKGLAAAERIAHYATLFDTVEIDMSFYRVPSHANIASWRSRTPPGFLFAAKAPQTVTADFVHRSGAREANSDFLDPVAMEGFVSTMGGLGDRLGPLLLQFPYFAASSFPSLGAFLERLGPFLDSLPRGPSYAVELRNPSWFTSRLVEWLGEKRVALCLTDLTMTSGGGGAYGPPSGPRLAEKFGDRIVTGDHVMIRLLGNRIEIEKKTKTFDRVVEPRDDRLGPWAELILALADKGAPVFAYANNHYEGYAPETLRKIRGMIGLQGPAYSP